MKLHHQETAQAIKEILTAKFEPTTLELIDESHLHAKHAEAQKRPKAGHFRVIVTSQAFLGKSSIERHRMVFDALKGLMTERIHALTLKLNAPSEET